MTDQTLYERFIAHFDPHSLVKKSLRWSMDVLPGLEEELEEAVTLLQEQSFSREERNTLYAERGRLKKAVAYDDPAYVKNKEIDNWIRQSKLRIRGLSKNECRNIILQRLNIMLKSSGEKIVLRSKGKKGGMYVMDQLNASIYDTLTANDRNTQSIKNRSKRIVTDWDTTASLYELDPVFIESMKSPLQVMALNQDNIPGEHRQLVTKIDFQYRPLIEMERDKILGTEQQKAINQ